MPGMLLRRVAEPRSNLSESTKRSPTDPTEEGRVSKYRNIFAISGKSKLFAIEELMTVVMTINAAILYGWTGD